MSRNNTKQHVENGIVDSQINYHIYHDCGFYLYLG